MPIYEFICGDCGHEFEKIMSFSASTPVCARCGAANVTRQMGRPAIHFKGSGWYINDSKKGKGKNGSNNPASAPAGEAGEGGESGESSGEKTAAESTASTENGKSESKAADKKEPAPSRESSSSAPAAKTESV